MMRPQEILQAALKNRRDPENSVHKVLNIDEVDESKLKWPAIVQYKEDGVYAAFIVSAGEVLIVSRTMRPLQNVQHLSRSPGQFIRPGCQEGVFIAELVQPELSLEELSGILNPNRVEPLTADMQAKALRIDPQFHDYLSLRDWYDGYTIEPYETRWARLILRLKDTAFAVGSSYTTDMANFEEQAAAVIANGREGVVLKQLDAPWIAGKKDFNYTKRVRELHVDLRCIGATYGKGKRAGLIARLHFEYKGKPFAADLGKGWTDERRVELTEAFELDSLWNPVGKVFHVKALQESSRGVLRLPKVMEMRIDKEVPDAV